MNPVSWRSVMGRDYNCRLNNSHFTCGHSDGAGITGELALGSHRKLVRRQKGGEHHAAQQHPGGNKQTGVVIAKGFPD